MPDSFEHMASIVIRMPCAALTSLAGFTSYESVKIEAILGVMTAIGTYRTFRTHRRMSAFGGKADIE